MEQYDDEEVGRARVLSNGQVLAFIAGYWRRRSGMFALAALFSLIAICFEMMMPTAAQRLVARTEGIWTAPESAALVAALGQLKDRGEALRDAEIMLIFTGAGLKYAPPALGAPTDLEGSEEEVLAKVRRTVGA